MPSGTIVEGITLLTFSAFVVKPKKKNPKTIVVGNIIMIPAIFSFVLSAINERKVIRKPPAINETNN